MSSRTDITTVADMLAQSARDHAKANPQGTSLAEFYKAQAATVIEHFAEREQTKWQEGYDHAVVLCRIKIRQAAQQPPSDALKIIFEQRAEIAELKAEMHAVEEDCGETIDKLRAELAAAKASAEPSWEDCRRWFQTMVEKIVGESYGADSRMVVADVAAHDLVKFIKGEKSPPTLEEILARYAHPGDREDDAEGLKTYATDEEILAYLEANPPANSCVLWSDRPEDDDAGGE
ncbi:hypothetical protein [Phenylobacterium sp. SCN 70-31]|uniref:hypothetical protein n=1 Tax=Phenylobacterium sp. SCN 70-31 TaxID=1660129 RepID=UPI00086B806E|nr:hypothetical protein [Phenylobacterium sp. SCN 70-31]ODT84848.1 MAG: hypothetical protein ABS78_22080 [Phenylobacterium sp. SCN 70-31]